MLGSLAQKMDLATGVLDGTGDLTQLKLRGGRQALLKRLEQIMAAVPADGARPAPAAPPGDPAVAFASRLRQKLANRLAHCDEVWLPNSDTPVLVTVVRDPVAECEPAVAEVFRDTAWNESPPVLQVMAAATWDALQHLASAGMITLHARAIRPLLPADGQAAPGHLTPEQLRQIDDLLKVAHKSARVAKALVAADLVDDARAPLESAIVAFARAWAVRNHRPQPEQLNDLLRPPCDQALPAHHLAVVRAWADSPAASALAPLAAFLVEHAEPT
jgi:hypothetical protein